MYLNLTNMKNNDSNSVSDLWGQQIGLDLDPKWG